MHSKLHLKLGGLLIVGLVLLLGTAPLWAQAAPPPLPTRPLPTATPTPSLPPIVTVTPAPESVQGSAIVLEARSTADLEWAKLWTVVERQTEDGAWQAVEGWQGAFDSVDAGVGYKTWDVPPNLFGQGPFRWRVEAEQSGLTLATSQTFTLPDRAGVRLVVVVTVPATPVLRVLLPESGASVGWVGVLILFVGVLFVWRMRTDLSRR